MNTKQDIVPVKLTHEPTSRHHRHQNEHHSPSKLVARLKFSQTELFLYEHLNTEILRILLSELHLHENH